MGLDMFLDGIEYKRQEYDKNFNVTKKRKIIKTLEINWRKANMIHKWFVDNIQYGNDDCGVYDVSSEQLLQLKNKCIEVLKNKENAENILPTQTGFFFGGTQYDDWYFNELKRTADEIERLLKNNKYNWYEYSSSW